MMRKFYQVKNSILSLNDVNIEKTSVMNVKMAAVFFKN